MALTDRNYSTVINMRDVIEYKRTCWRCGWSYKTNQYWALRVNYLGL